MNASDSRDSASREERVNEIIAAYLQALDAGQAPHRQALIREHPEFAAELRAYFDDQDGLQSLADLAGPLQPITPPVAEIPTLAPGDPAIKCVSAGARVRRFGDYELLAEIARGGMGVIYKARQVSLNRSVAIKMILTGQLASAMDVQRFHTEAEAAANLDHPNIVPIYEVGEHESQHYFSMKVIEGPSLGQWIADCRLQIANSKKEHQTVSARLIATIAHAVHHAHQRGILHRDLKPGNILLQPDESAICNLKSAIPMVTDFGLAKRVTREPSPGVPAAPLTQSGAIVGTPAYMAPEQAAGKKGLTTAVDIYSLGAILYELLTGRPPFQAEMPIELLLQVLHSEPERPSALTRGLDRDLETICLKCLEKDPQRRYSSAEALAQDLEHWLADEPIQARPTGTMERMARWIRKRRRSITMTAVTAAACVLFVVVALVGWQWYAESRLGRLLLTTEGPPLVGEVLFEKSDDLVVKPFTVPTQEPISLPAGSHRLRLSGQGTLSETVQLLVRKGIQQQFSVELGAGKLWEPISVSQRFDVVDLAGRSDVILIDERGLRRLDGASARVIWERTLDAANFPGVAKAGGFDWKTWFGSYPPNQFGSRDYARLVKPAPDLDGDGVRDLVWVGNEPAAILAVSGKDGKRMWSFTTKPLYNGEMKQIPPELFESTVVGYTTITGQPVQADVNGDGTQDLIAAFEVPKANSGVTLHNGATIPRQRWIEAVCGRTGKSLWRQPIDRPRDLTAHPSRIPQLARVGGKLVVVAMAGSALIGLEVKTGKPAWPAYEVGPWVQELRVADLRGDGQDEVLLFGPIGTIINDQSININMGAGLRLVALSLTTLTALWNVDLPWQGQARYPGFVVADLDGDGKPEVILYNSAEHNWWGVDVLDGATGKSRWPDPLSVERWREAPSCLGLLVGPDIDGDGHHDLFVASQGSFGGKRGDFLFIDALSGNDGRILWTWRRPVPESGPGGTGVGQMKWWQPGLDGWPQLAVPIGKSDTERTGTTYVLAAGSGHLEHLVQGWFDVEQADFNGDGIPDLYEYRPDQPYQAGWPGKISALRGLPPAAWRRLDRVAPAHDFNGDGIADLLGEFPSSSNSSASAGLFVVSGRDGQVLWHAQTEGLSSNSLVDRTATATPPAGDLDGDGLIDVVLFTQTRWADSDLQAPLRAFSGKTGHLLWAANDLRVREGESITCAHFLECRNDLDGEGQPKVLLAYSRSRQAILENSQMFLAVLTGRDGKRLWEQPLSGRREQDALSQQGRIAVVAADLNGDGVSDLVVWGVSDRNQWELRAFKGQDGTPLWRYETSMNATGASHSMMAPVVGDLDGGGVPAVLFWDYKDGAVALEGKSGRRLWNYPVRGTDNDSASHWPVLLNLDGDGRHCVALSDGEGFNSDLILLNHQGRVRQRLRLANHQNQFHLGDKPFQFFNGTLSGRLWSIDLDGDGRDELVGVVRMEFLDLPFRAGAQNRIEYRVRASRRGVEPVLWEWPVLGEPVEILGVQPGRNAQPATVVVRAGRTVYGLIGSTGRPCWRCEDPRPTTARSQSPELFLLDSNDSRGWPRVVFHSLARSGAVTGTVCRPAWPSLPTGQYAPSKGPPLSSSGPLLDDPRFARPLPWVADAVQFGWHYMALAAGAVLALGASLARWRLRPAAGYVGFLGFGLFYAPWFIVFLALPAGMYLYCLMSFARKRQWGPLVWVLILTLAITLAVCLPWLYFDNQAVGSSRYVWSGWYGVFLVGVYAMGMLIPLAMGIRSMLIRPYQQG